jgi:hypothetical protein
MYQYTTTTGHTVEWIPADTVLAAQAMEDVNGTGVPNTYTLPDEANVPIDNDVAQKVRARYRELTAWKLSIALDDGDVQAGGADSEPVTVTVLDENGERVSGEHRVYLLVDGDSKPVDTVDGEGVYNVTSTKPAGSTVTVQADGSEDHHATASAEEKISVV